MEIQNKAYYWFLFFQDKLLLKRKVRRMKFLVRKNLLLV